MSNVMEIAAAKDYTHRARQVDEIKTVETKMGTAEGLAMGAKSWF